MRRSSCLSRLEDLLTKHCPHLVQAPSQSPQIQAIKVVQLHIIIQGHLLGLALSSLGLHRQQETE